MPRIWSLIAVVIAGCSSGNAAGQESAAIAPSCVEVAISELPISENSLRERISELTGYQSEYELGRPCRFGGGYLLRMIPPKEHRHGIFTVLFLIGADKEVRIVPSQ